MTWRRRSPVVVHGELMARATASKPDSGASPPPSATSPLTNSEKPARSSGRVKNGDSSQGGLTVRREVAESDKRTRS